MCCSMPFCCRLKVCKQKQWKQNNSCAFCFCAHLPKIPSFTQSGWCRTFYCRIFLIQGYSCRPLPSPFFPILPSYLLSSHSLLLQPLEPECQAGWDDALEMWRTLHHSLHGQPVCPGGDLIRRAQCCSSRCRGRCGRCLLSKQHRTSIRLVDVASTWSVNWSGRKSTRCRKGERSKVEKRRVRGTTEHQPAILQEGIIRLGERFSLEGGVIFVK